MAIMSPLRYIYLLLAIALIGQAVMLMIYVIPQEGIKAGVPWVLALVCLFMGIRS